MAEDENISEISGERPKERAKEAHWPKVIFYIYLQLLALYGIILIFTHASVATTMYSFLLIFMGVIGVNAGAHRLWAHQSYTATPGLKVFLMLCQTLSGQGTIYDWVKYHRLHHKYFSTKQDPFNPSKGFLYAHILCLMEKSTPEQEELANAIDMTDLEEDKVVMFQKKYYWFLYLIVFLSLPVYIPMWWWKEAILPALLLPGFMRYDIILHFSWLVHSSSTIFGLQKGEKYPPDTNLVFLWYKTQWLQYHYLTPWDYQTSEYGNYGKDPITAFIRVCAALELASNLRTTDCALIQSALFLSMETNRSISECLLEIESNGNLAKDHYLDPKKYH